MNILVSGYGRMGQRLEHIIQEDDVFSICAIVDYDGENGFQSIEDVQQVPDVIIDFSHPSTLHDLLAYATKHSVPIVLATTNYAESDRKAINKASESIPVFQTSNTSFGIQVLLEAVKTVQQLVPDADIEVIETHHNKKIDAPSGTANMIVEELSDASTIHQYGRRGDMPRHQSEIGIHSIRGGSVAGNHDVQFFLNGEHITISHNAESKDVFAYGALRAAQYIVSCDNGYYNMKDLIKEYIV